MGAEMNKRIFTFIFIILLIIGLIGAFFVYRYNNATTEYYWKDNTRSQKNEKFVANPNTFHTFAVPIAKGRH